MNKRGISRKQIVRGFVIVLVIVGILLTMHFLVNNFDFLGFLRGIHG
jgi:preprotein translocase subunit SecE